MKEEIITQLNNNIKWLDDYIRVDNIADKGAVIDKINILCVSLAEEVSTAYAVMNDLEDEYKAARADFISKFEGAHNKAEIAAEVHLKEQKRLWTQSKNVYRKLSTYLERIDKVTESHRQRISVVKQVSLKNMSGV